MNGLNEKSCFLTVHLGYFSFDLILFTLYFVLRDLDIIRNEKMDKMRLGNSVLSFISPGTIP